MKRRPFGRFPYRKRSPFERPFKPRGPLLPGRSLNPRVQRELRRANHLMAIGEHMNAAQIFVSIANQARDLGIVYPAPMLLLQAAHAYLLGEQFKESLEQAKAGLELLTAQERWKALQEAGEGYIQALQGAGKTRDAQQLQTWLTTCLQGKAVETATVAQLPERCPYCGASMSLAQINAGSGQAAACQYCGSVVLAGTHR